MWHFKYLQPSCLWFWCYWVQTALSCSPFQTRTCKFSVIFSNHKSICISVYFNAAMKQKYSKNLYVWKTHFSLIVVLVLLVQHFYLDLRLMCLYTDRNQSSLCCAVRKISSRPFQSLPLNQRKWRINWQGHSSPSAGLALSLCFL